MSASMKRKYKKSNAFTGLNKMNATDYVIMIILVIFALSVILPFMNVISISLSNDDAYRANPSMLLPKNITFKGYAALLGGVAVWRSIFFTIIYVVFFVVLRLLTSLFAGYAISRRNLPGKRIMTTYLLIPTLFSGGMIPTYLILTSLGFMDNILVFIIPGCVSTYHILLMKTYIRGLPDSVEDAAKIDGCNTMQLLFKVLTPMCIPILCTIGMLTAIAKWNEWLFGDLYIDANKYLLPLQNIIMKLRESSQSDLAEMGFGSTQAQGFQNAFNMASVMVVTLPIMLIYPFIQKYFEQGLNVGSVKG